MAFENLIVEKRGAVAWICLNRPQARNALNLALRKELYAALEEGAADDSVKVLVIAGTGDGAFCAGGDLRELADRTPLAAREYLSYSRAVTQSIQRTAKPVIAAVRGLALGGGCELALACDLIYASEDAQFGQPEIKVGLLPGGGGTQRLPRLVGIHKAKELMLLGEPISAREAERIGLVNRVYPREELEGAVQDVAEKLAERSSAILGLIKAATNQALEASLQAGLEFEVASYALCFGTEDQKEGVKAFLEKRAPRFKGA